LVNIFGGIMKCDTIASGILEALKHIKVKQPIVVRLSGTRADIGQKMLAESGHNLIAATDLDDAAAKVVAAVEKLKKK
jgi:succinyl-CoA synthetase beta subunit